MERWCALLLAVLGCRGCDEPVEIDAGAPEVRETHPGAPLYATYCALCHGADGEGYAADHANALGNDAFLRSVSDDFLRTAIREGRPGTPMAAYGQARGGPLDAEQIDLLVRYLRRWQESPPLELPATTVQGDPGRARPLFAQHCAQCHGETGEGREAVSLNNPVFLGSASDAQIRDAIAEGRPGTPMEGFEERLGQQAVRDLTALIRSWQRDVPERPTPTFVDGPVVVNPEGEAPDFGELREGRYVPSAKVAAALEAGQRMVLLDARAPSDYALLHLPGAVPSPYYDIEALQERLPRDGTWIIAYCACPHAASGRVMDRLRREGFENTAVLDEGVFHWRDQGYPTATGATPYGDPPAAPETRDGL